MADLLQWYPTPKALAERLFAKLDCKNFHRILEPSAGDGALLAGLPERYRERYSRCAIDCIEIDIQHHDTLRKAGFKVVGFDFLSFKDASCYSAIVLNPPFRVGVQHVLHAWNILLEGDIGAIINADSLRNPHTRERKALLDLINTHGSYEIVTGAFMVEEAERKTSVDVALVHLKKSANIGDMVGNLIGDLRKDAETGAGLMGDVSAPSALVLPSSHIENTVIAFRAAVQAMREAKVHDYRASYYARLLGDTLAVRNGDDKTHRANPISSGQSIGELQSAIYEAYKELKDRAWASLLRSTNISSRLSQSAQRRLEAGFEDVKSLEFSVANIYGFIQGLCAQQGQMMNEMLADCFDTFSRHHSANVSLYRGWKSNARHRSAGMKLKTTRFIVPGHSVASCRHGADWRTIRFLEDFDKCFATLDGAAEAPYGLARLFTEQFDALFHGQRVDSSYFSARFYPHAGTIHLFPLRKDLIDRLNRTVGTFRQWLPASDTMASDQFWHHYAAADGLDKAVREELVKTQASRWDDPLRRAFYGSTQEKERAFETLDLAVERVFAKAGIPTDALLANSAESACLQLELLAA